MRVSYFHYFRLIKILIIFFVLLFLTITQVYAEGTRYYFWPDTDVTIYKTASVHVDSNGNYYITYPKICLNENSQASQDITHAIEYEYSYGGKIFPVGYVKCKDVNTDYLTLSNLDFDISIFPYDTTFYFDAIFFSSDLSEQIINGYSNLSYAYGNPKILKNTDYYRTFRSNVPLDILQALGLKAFVSQDYPLAIKNHYVENIITEFTGSKLISKQNSVGVNINIDSLKFKISDYHLDKEKKLRVQQFRNPVLASGNFGAISTVFLARLLIEDSEVTRICSNFAKEYSIKKSLIEEGKYYSNAIQTLAEEDSSDLFEIAISFYNESQQSIESIIEYIKENLDENVEKQLLIESLSAISIVKNNACLNSLSVNEFRENIEQSQNTINQCYQANKITSVQKSILEQLLNLGQNKYTISNEIEYEIGRLARHESKKRTDFLDIKTKIKKFYYGVSWQLQSKCADGLGVEWKEIIHGE